LNIFILFDNNSGVTRNAAATLVIVSYSSSFCSHSFLKHMQCFCCQIFFGWWLLPKNLAFVRKITAFPDSGGCSPSPARLIGLCLNQDVSLLGTGWL